MKILKKIISLSVVVALIAFNNNSYISATPADNHLTCQILGNPPTVPVNTRFVAPSHAQNRPNYEPWRYLQIDPAALELSLANTEARLNWYHMHQYIVNVMEDRPWFDSFFNGMDEIIEIDIPSALETMRYIAQNNLLRLGLAEYETEFNALFGQALLIAASTSPFYPEAFDTFSRGTIIADGGRESISITKAADWWAEVVLNFSYDITIHNRFWDNLASPHYFEIYELLRATSVLFSLVNTIADPSEEFSWLLPLNVSPQLYDVYQLIKDIDFKFNLYEDMADVFFDIYEAMVIISGDMYTITSFDGLPSGIPTLDALPSPDTGNILPWQNPIGSNPGPWPIQNMPTTYGKIIRQDTHPDARYLGEDLVLGTNQLHNILRSYYHIFRNIFSDYVQHYNPGVKVDSSDSDAFPFPYGKHGYRVTNNQTTIYMDINLSNGIWLANTEPDWMLEAAIYLLSNNDNVMAISFLPISSTTARLMLIINDTNIIQLPLPIQTTTSTNNTTLTVDNARLLTSLGYLPIHIPDDNNIVAKPTAPTPPPPAPRPPSGGGGGGGGGNTGGALRPTLPPITPPITQPPPLPDVPAYNPPTNIEERVIREIITISHLGEVTIGGREFVYNPNDFGVPHINSQGVGVLPARMILSILLNADPMDQELFTWVEADRAFYVDRTNRGIRFEVDNTIMLINGQPRQILSGQGDMAFLTAPYIDITRNQRLFVPTRAIAETLGFSVHWNTETAMITLIPN